MIQTVAWGEDYANLISKQVNEWLADRAHKNYQILDIQFSTGEYSGAMIIYDDDVSEANYKPLDLPSKR